LAFRDRAFLTYFTYKKHLDMIRETFGQLAVDNISEMVSVLLRRWLPEPALAQ
jgi:hypothetical protein